MKKVRNISLVVGGILLAMSIAFMVSCEESGTTTTKVALSTVTLEYGGTPAGTITATAGTANSTGISPTWTLASSTGITYSIAKAATGGPTTDGTSGTATVMIDSASGKITITDAAVADNTGKYIVTATAGATSPNYTSGTTQTAEITVTVSAAAAKTALPALTYADLTITAGTADTTGVSPTWNPALSDTTGITYAIAKDTGTITAAVVIDTASGKVTVTAAIADTDKGDYTVTATAGATAAYTAGTKTATLTIN